MKKYAQFLLILSSLLLAACAPPSATFDAAQISTIKTIAVAAPTDTYYIASTPSGVSFIGGIGGLIVDGIGAISAADRAKQRANFNDLVKAKLGDTKLSRKFTDAIEAELRAQGYVVSEIDLSKDGMPKVVYDNAAVWTLKGAAGYTGADAILVARVNTAYFAQGTIYPFTRNVTGSVKIYRSDTGNAVFQERLYFVKFSDPYTYPTFGDLVKDLPHAVAGLNEAEMGFIPEFAENLKASRLGIQTAGQVTDSK